MPQIPSISTHKNTNPQNPWNVPANWREHDRGEEETGDNELSDREEAKGMEEMN